MFGQDCMIHVFDGMPDGRARSNCGMRMALGVHYHVPGCGKLLLESLLSQSRRTQSRTPGMMQCGVWGHWLNYIPHIGNRIRDNGCNAFVCSPGSVGHRDFAGTKSTVAGYASPLGRDILPWQVGLLIRLYNPFPFGNWGFHTF